MMKNVVISIFVGLISCVLAAPAQALTIDLLPVQDTFVMSSGVADNTYYGDSRTLNFGSSPELQADQFVTNHSASFLQFSLASLGAGATITSATLYTHVYGIARSNDNDPNIIPQIGAHQVNQSWNENTLTWNDVFTGYGGSYTIDNNFYTVTPFDTDSWTNATMYPDWMTFDATALAQSWHAGAVNNGIALTAQTVDVMNETTFYSSDANPNSYPPVFPYLQIEYTTGGTGNTVPEPATMALLGVGLTGLALRRRKV